jgi:hypothetical protein
MTRRISHGCTARQRVPQPTALLAGHKSLQNETPREPKTPPAEVWLGTCLVAEQFSHDVTPGTGKVNLLV